MGNKLTDRSGVFANLHDATTTVESGAANSGDGNVADASCVSPEDGAAAAQTCLGVAPNHDTSAAAYTEASVVQSPTAVPTVAFAATNGVTASATCKI